MDLSQLPADLWSTRLPASLLDRAPHVEERDGQAVWVCDGKVWGRWDGKPPATGSARPIKALYNPEQDRNKRLGQKVYEKVVEGVSKVLKNTPRKEIATVANISSPVESAKANTFEVVIKLVQNAFFKAILPGFEQQLRGVTGRGRGSSAG